MSEEIKETNYWLVGSKWDNIDKTEDFVRDGVWINGFDDKYLDRVKSVNIGDKIAIKSSYVKSKNLPFNNHDKSVSVMKIKAIGKVVENPKDGKKLEVVWDNIFKPKEIYVFSYRNTISKIDKDRWKVPIKWIFEGKEQDDFFSFNNAVYKEDDDMPNDTKQTQPLNQILYGPPGTGKTYNTINKALEIIDNEFYKQNKSDRDALKEKFEEYKKAGQIEFVTFHQSYGYEEFVEGIKAKTNEETKNIEYEIEAGIFKQLCEKASTKSSSNIEEKIEWLKTELINEKEIEIKYGKSKFKVSYRGGRTFRIQPENSKNENSDYPASIENIIKLYKGGKRNEIYNPTYTNGILEYLYKNGLKKYDEIQDTNKKNYILIIDEINRGNISKIFGELITLIEPSKRIGADEEIRVKLSYSGDSEEPFGVPSNLYIIGTMNTADRSIAPIDTALRRRFVFEEMAPNPSLSKDIKVKDGENETGIELKKLLEAINTRIEYLYDRDHTIGHAYLIDVKSLDDLKFAFKNKIIPLLAEYFYEDWENIDLVLNKNGMIEEEKANSDYLKNIGKINGKKIYKVSDKNWEVGNFEKIYKDDALSQTDEQSESSNH
jgi:5-methylcytosine-specific restriction protein B